MQNFLDDWQFWVTIGAIIVAIIESRHKLAQLWRSHQMEIDPEKQRLRGERDALTTHSLRSLADNVQEMKATIARLEEKHSDGSRRIWTDVERIKIDIGRLEEISRAQIEGDVDRRQRRPARFREDIAGEG